VIKIFKSTHTLISNLPYWWPWMYNGPWFLMTEENRVPLRVPETCPGTLSWSGQLEPPGIDTYNTYQPINSSCGSSRKPTVNQGEEPQSVPPTLWHQCPSRRCTDQSQPPNKEPGSHTNQLATQSTQGKLLTTLYIT